MHSMNSMSTTNLPNLKLITGAVRSGKSLFAEKLAKEANSAVVYIATMPHLNDDVEQQRRIHMHKQRRPSSWQTIEAPYELPDAIGTIGDDTKFCIIDCLTVYVSNVLITACGDNAEQPYACEDTVFAKADAVIDAIASKRKTQFVVVTNEVGWGVVPETPLGRAFRDFAGIVNQKFAGRASEVWLTCSGLPLRLKPQTDS
jgi:adenosylcobinamide kinase/adenosylcobinamide-phosphate guanylyltransferase